MSGTRLYHHEHLWVELLDGDEGRVGISAFARAQLKEIVFVDFPAVGSELVQGVPFGVVEASKVVSDLYAPVSGVVLAINKELRDEVSIINSDPEDKGWIARIRISDPNQLSTLLYPEKYRGLFGDGI